MTNTLIQEIKENVTEKLSEIYSVINSEKPTSKTELKHWTEKIRMNQNLILKLKKLKGNNNYLQDEDFTKFTSSIISHFRPSIDVLNKEKININEIIYQQLIDSISDK